MTVTADLWPRQCKELLPTLRYPRIIPPCDRLSQAFGPLGLKATDVTQSVCFWRLCTNFAIAESRELYQSARAADDTAMTARISREDRVIFLPRIASASGYDIPESNASGLSAVTAHWQAAV